MKGAERRAEIIRRISSSEKPVSGTDLAAEYGVSRQVIVQDIALLRATGCQIISTNRGYLLVETDRPRRVFKVSHTAEQMEDELNAVVDLSGTVVNVFVWHRVYGKVTGYLDISSRRKVREFLEGIRESRSAPLMNITSGYHYHTVEAPDEETLELIGQELSARGYLLPED